MALPYVGKILKSLLTNTTQKTYDSSTYVSGYVDMYPIRNIYMTSSSVGEFNTMSILETPVNAEHGDIIFDQTLPEWIT